MTYLAMPRDNFIQIIFATYVIIPLYFLPVILAGDN
jgi:hypothetical protein